MLKRRGVGRERVLMRRGFYEERECALILKRKGVGEERGRKCVLMLKRKGVGEER